MHTCDKQTNRFVDNIWPRTKSNLYPIISLDRPFSCLQRTQIGRSFSLYRIICSSLASRGARIDLPLCLWSWLTLADSYELQSNRPNLTKCHCMFWKFEVESHDIIHLFLQAFIRILAGWKLSFGYQPQFFEFTLEGHPLLADFQPLYLRNTSESSLSPAVFLRILAGWNSTSEFQRAITRLPISSRLDIWAGWK